MHGAGTGGAAGQDLAALGQEPAELRSILIIDERGLVHAELANLPAFAVLGVVLIEIVADNVYFGESRRDNESNSYAGSYDNSGRGGSYGSQPSSAPAPSAFSELDDGDGELPF